MDIENIRAAYSGRKSVGECFLVALNILGHINQYDFNETKVSRY